MSNTHELIFQPGLVVDEEFFDYAVMQSSAKNWLFFTRYRFGTGDFYGRHSGVQLNNLQFGHADRHEGMMYEGISPKDCITIAILKENSGHVCINRVKMERGDLILIDDSSPYDFVSSHHTLMSIISVRKSLLALQAPWMLSSINKKFKDIDNTLCETITREWEDVLASPSLLKNAETLQSMENKIIDTLKHVLYKQTGEDCTLTQGEKVAFEIKSCLLDSLEDAKSIQDIAKKFKVSEKTIESSFKTLFGITPKRFIKLLKLNHAHKDLQLANVQTTNVSDIAIKWGFSHFGRFSSDYKSLFGVSPSIILNQTPTH